MPRSKSKSKSQTQIRSLEELFPGKDEEFLYAVRSAFIDLSQDVGPWDAKEGRVVTVVDSDGVFLFCCLNRHALRKTSDHLERAARSKDAIALRLV